MNSEPLGVIAEIAVTITGFTAIAALFGRRNGRGWSAAERLQLRVLVRTSVIAVFVSFVPELLVEVVPDVYLVWRWSCGVLGLTLLADLTWFLSHRGSGAITPEQRVASVFAFIVLASLLGSSAGFLASPRLIFLAGLLFMVAIALLNFVVLLITGMHTVSDSSEI